MRMTMEKRSDVYGAIRGPITDLRLKVSRSDAVLQEPLIPRQIDDELLALEDAIWQRVKTALNLEPTP